MIWIDNLGLDTLLYGLEVELTGNHSLFCEVKELIQEFRILKKSVNQLTSLLQKAKKEIENRDEIIDKVIEENEKFKKEVGSLIPLVLSSNDEVENNRCPSQEKVGDHTESFKNNKAKSSKKGQKVSKKKNK